MQRIELFLKKLSLDSNLPENATETETDKTSKEYENTKMKICINYIIINISSSENKGVISTKF